jgi:pyruvate dehydrogenase E2 component (dihydrolipoamide acetyltransferase)
VREPAGRLTLNNNKETSMALVEVKVPDIGDFKDVEVIELLVKPGDTVKVEQSLITVESDKASMEIPSSHAGVVKEMKIKLGDKVGEGSLLLMLQADTSAAAPAAAGAVADAEASACSISSRLPSPTLSPSLTFISLTTPACDEGISIDALSLSTVTSDCSTLTVSPGLTSSSMTSTSLKSPMSGTLTSTRAMLVSLSLLFRVRRRAGSRARCRCGTS